MAVLIDSSDDVFRYKIDLAKLIKNLDYGDEEIADAARQQPKLFLWASIYKVQKFRKQQLRESKLRLLRSQYAREIRREMQENGERVTDKQIEERLSRKKEIIHQTRRVEAAEQEHDLAKLLVEAYRQKLAALKIGSELIGAEVYVTRKMEGGDSELSRMKKHLMNKAAGQMIREKRRQDGD